jgi:hypothetical protein
MNNYLDTPTGPCKGPMQVRGPEFSDSLVDKVYVLKDLLVPITF